jgi:hypothetical protein
MHKIACYVIIVVRWGQETGQRRALIGMWCEVVTNNGGQLLPDNEIKYKLTTKC